MYDKYLIYGDLYNKDAEEDIWNDYDKILIEQRREYERQSDALEESMYDRDCGTWDEWWKDLPDEELMRLQEEYYQEEEKRRKNERRDEKGRLQKGSRIAAKKSCDKDHILRLYHTFGYSVKQITEALGCSKSTVYRAIKGK